MAFVNAFISLVSLLTELVSGVKALTAFIQANKEEKWFKESADLFSQLRTTVNDKSMGQEDRTHQLKEVGRGLRDLLGRL